VHVVLNNIARLAECTPASVGESPQWSGVTLKVAETSRNLLKGKPSYSTLHGLYGEVLNDLKVVLKESEAKEEATTSPFKEVEANEEFGKQNYSDDQAKNLRMPLCPPLE
jgi:hypothetical protein